MVWINQRSHSQSNEINPVSVEAQDKDTDNEGTDESYETVCVAFCILYR